MRSIYQKLLFILTLQCQRASELTSESCERRLLRHERVALVLHKVSCWSCRQFEKQLRFLRTAMQRLESGESEAGVAGQELDPRFKEKLKQLKA